MAENVQYNKSEFEMLDHEPIPGYRTAFHIVIGLFSLYLICIFILSFM
jgi:hypothetical protein